MTPTIPTFSQAQLSEACAQPGCPLCRLSDQVVTRYLSSILYENVNDPGVRDELRRSQGYCQAHAWRLTEMTGGVALGVALVYRGLVNDLGATLAEARYAQRRSLSQPDRQAARRVAADQPPRSLAPDLGCPACAQRDQLEAIALQGLLTALAQHDPTLTAALHQSDGLCLPHLRRALAQAPSAEVFDELREEAGQHLARLSAELSEFIRKNDYRFVGEAFGPEGDSWQRAVAALVGGRGRA